MNLQKYALKIGSKLIEMRVSLVAQMVKNLPAMWETRVQTLDWRRFPGERNGNPLQYSCLESSTDRGEGGLQSMGSQRVRHD